MELRGRQSQAGQVENDVICSMRDALVRGQGIVIIIGDQKSV